MKLFIDTVMKRIYLFNIVAWNYRKKIGFPVCKKANFAGLEGHRKRGKSARASPIPHHTLNEERSARRRPRWYKFEFSFVRNDRQPSQKSGMRPEKSLFPTIPDDRRHLRFRVFVSEQNLGRSGNSKIHKRLEFSRHINTRFKQAKKIFA